MNIFNPVVGSKIPWYLEALLFFKRTKWSHDTPIKGFHTTWSVGYKVLNGVVYIVEEKVREK